MTSVAVDLTILDSAPPATGDAVPLLPVDRRIYLVAGAAFALLMAFSTRYGFHNDELYFMDGGRHLALGYVDQPILTPLIARLSLNLFGVSLPGLRLWPSLAAAGTVVLGGLLAREFGGGRRAQLLGALGAATAPAVLGADHILGPTAFDLLAWAALALVVVRIGRTGDTRLWVPAGMILGLGLANKHSIGFFALAVVIGIALSGGRRLLTNRFFLIGVLIAFAFTIPDLWWQAHHGWATITMTKALNQENGGAANGVKFLLSQLFMAAPVLIGMWIAGLRFLWRSGRPAWRALAWSYGLLVVFFAATAGAKPYYVAATYIFLLAAGAVSFERRWAVTPGRARTLLVALALCVLVTLPLVVPVIPARDVQWTDTVNPVQTQTIGWPQLVHTVAGVWNALPMAQRADAVIFTADYGEAGAINELGRSEHLPEAVSGHNSVWFWGPGNPNATTIVAVVMKGQDDLLAGLHHAFVHVQLAATITNPAHIVNENYGSHVYICNGPVIPWGQMWRYFRHYD